MIDIERVDYLLKLVKEKLSSSYLLGFNNKTYVVVFEPQKTEELKNLLEENCATHEGICYYFFGFSVAMWEDVCDMIGFKGEHVCCIEVFEGYKINREFYWRHKAEEKQKVRR